jgi:hypothetical protein
MTLIAIARTVASGERTRVGAAWNINPDCSVKTIADVRVREAPNHSNGKAFASPFFLVQQMTAKVQFPDKLSNI